jgi:parvulin-like peptidyl-prolyl isomerase
MENPTLVSIGGKPITHNDVLIRIKAKGIYKSTIQELLKVKAIEVYAEQNKIEVEDTKLQEFVNEKRKQMGLTSSEATQKHLNSLGITPDQWIDGLEYEILEQQVRKSIITDDKVEDYFRQNQLQFLKIDLFKISVDKESEAEELLMEIRDDGKEFTSLAKKYSNDPSTNLAGGYAGKLGRGQLSVDLEQKIFTANEGDLLGPVKEGDSYSVYQIGKQYKAELDEGMKQNIADSLYNMWQNQIMQSFKIEVGGGE